MIPFLKWVFGKRCSKSMNSPLSILDFNPSSRWQVTWKNWSSTCKSEILFWTLIWTRLSRLPGGAFTAALNHSASMMQSFAFFVAKSIWSSWSFCYCDVLSPLPDGLAVSTLIPLMKLIIWLVSVSWGPSPKLTFDCSSNWMDWFLICDIGLTNSGVPYTPSTKIGLVPSLAIIWLKAGT